MVDLADDSEALQQAVASNYVDLIAIVPHGFASDYQKYLDGSSNDQPTVETVVSYHFRSRLPFAAGSQRIPVIDTHRYLGQAGKQQSMENGHADGVGYRESRCQDVENSGGAIAIRRY